jgi:hypothetical protein
VTFRFAELVGYWRLVVSDVLVEFVERAFVLPAPPSERERVRREALDEANAAELVVEADGTVVSRAGASEFYRVKLALEPGELEAVRFEKSPGVPVTLVLVEPERVIAHQPNKPPAEFSRAIPKAGAK